MSKFYKINEKLRLTSEVIQNSDSSKVRFESIASTSYKSGKSNHRINLPVFANEKGELGIPAEEIPADLVDIILKSGEWNVYLRSRSEVLRNFTMLMKYDPECLALKSSRN